MKRSDIRTKLQGATPFFPNMLNNYAVEICLKEDVDKYCDELENKLKLDQIEIKCLKDQLKMINDLRARDIQLLMQTSSERQDTIIELTQKVAELTQKLSERRYYNKFNSEGCRVKKEIKGKRWPGRQNPKRRLRKKNLR